MEEQDLSRYLFLRDDLRGSGIPIKEEKTHYRPVGDLGAVVVAQTLSEGVEFENYGDPIRMPVAEIIVKGSRRVPLFLQSEYGLCGASFDIVGGGRISVDFKSKKSELLDVPKQHVEIVTRLLKIRGYPVSEKTQ